MVFLRHTKYLHGIFITEFLLKELLHTFTDKCGFWIDKDRAATN